MAQKSKKPGSTPLMEQYLSIKSKYQDMILLYRMGDFYETFYDDAITISRVLGIALTKRAHGKTADVPLAGFPYHALDNYLPKLVAAGHRVAICEQVEDPKLAKTVVKRDVVEIISPGTALSDKLLDHKSNNYLAAVYIDGDVAGISYGDFSTGEFCLSHLKLGELVNYILEINPREVLTSKTQAEQIWPSLENKTQAVHTCLDDWVFTHKYAYETLTAHFSTPNLKGFGAESFVAGTISAGAVLHYCRDNLHGDPTHIRKLGVISSDDFMILDESTRRNLEITTPIVGGGKEGTLLSVLDHTLTPMGSRRLRNMIMHPLIRIEPIQKRLDQVEALVKNKEIRIAIRDELGQVGDIERLLARVSTGRVSPRELVQLKNSLQRVRPVKEIMLQSGAGEVLTGFGTHLEAMDPVTGLITEGIVDEPPATISDGDIIREGYNAELDELRNISREGKSWIVDLQVKEKESTGIPTLKTGYNKVFGYYFEVTKAHADKVPEYFIRKQTLVNAERYITPELKEFEEKVLGAEEKMAELEHQLFREIRENVASWGVAIQENARLIAELDCLCGLAHSAVSNHYVKPIVDEGDVLEIQGGRHPVVEQLLPADQSFIDNDTALDNKKTQIMVITGPNMSGKSTYLRQVGLIVLLTQIGSFVPAESARMGVVDRIFTRVGASDNLAFGESTFMVEMLETANIINNASPRSLILLDEIGRGTSTFDGLSIAWAVTEYLHHKKSVAAKTLFATHYHELTELAMIYPRIANFRVTVKEYDDHVVFMHKIEPGGMDNSYGIYVAQMAGLPHDVVSRAREVLHNLEENELNPNRQPKIATHRPGMQVNKSQLDLFKSATNSRLESEIRKVEIDNLTPIDALLKLRELKQLLSD